LTQDSALRTDPPLTKDPTVKETKQKLLDVSKLPIDQAVAALINRAVRMGASDLFFVTNEQHVAVHVRHLGIMRLLSVVSPETGRRYLAHVKAMAGMDMGGAARRPIDGRWIYECDDAEADAPATEDDEAPSEAEEASVDLRISVIPTLHGEDFAIRLLGRGLHAHRLENLGMTRDQLSDFQAMIESPGGLVVLTGPTGSGKTATLYASLMRLNNGRRKINTIEDPVEYAVDGLRQSQVNPQTGLGFAELLRGALRQSPDVVMIGEIRDEETARTAVHAANSGILVFATVHAPAASNAVQSLRSLGVHNHFLGASLRGVVSQRLLRTLCPSCKTTFDLTDAPHTFDAVRPMLGAAEGRTLYAARGCPACNGTGYAGRTGVFEVMTVTRPIRDLVSDGAPTRDIRTAAVRGGMLEFRQAALLKVARGETSTEEMFRVIPTEVLVELAEAA
jgi:type II secretory ATPase GspE/PulE/Tfp pilus assembly ATPase PilB-like protein